MWNQSKNLESLRNCDKKVKAKFELVVCPGVHHPNLSADFIQDLQENSDRASEYKWLILPTQHYLPYSPRDVYQWLTHNYVSPLDAPPLVFICFSAGVVGGLGAALWWQSNGGKVKAFLALDGWGMPIVANFPVYRLSHDYFTHWSSALLGTGKDSFYADPAIEHLDLWRSPNTTLGWWVKSTGMKQRCSVAEFLQAKLFLSPK